MPVFLNAPKMDRCHKFQGLRLTLITAAALFVVGLSNFQTVNALTESQIQEIDNYLLSQFLPNNYIPGLGLAIVHGNDTLAKGYGIADLELGIPTRNNTLFGIGSISKSFTALIVVRVLSSTFPELGESVLDVPIRKLIPSYNFMLIDRFRSENMNFRDLLSHRVCVSPDPIGHYARTYNSTEEYMYRQRYAIEFCPVRSELVYHNGLIQMAGELVAAIANTTFEQLLNELLIDLGMTETGFIKESDELDTWPNLSKPYWRHQGVFGRYNPELLKSVFVAPGSGGIISSAADFIRYLTFWLNDGRIGSEQIVPEELVRWTRRFSNSFPTLTYKSSPSDLLYGDLGYGLGLFLGTYEGFFKYGHGGYLPPYLSLMTIVPELNVAIMTTGNGPGTLHAISQEAMHARLLSIITEVGKKAEKTENIARSYFSAALHNENGQRLDREPIKADIPPHLLQQWQSQPKNESLVGHYGNPLLGEFNVTAINSTTMYLKYGMFGTGYLTQLGNSAVYEVQWDSDIVHGFYVDGLDELPVVTLNFTMPLVAELALEAGVIPFYKDLSLDLLPVQPWDPNSC